MRRACASSRCVMSWGHSSWIQWADLDLGWDTGDQLQRSQEGPGGGVALGELGGGAGLKDDAAPDRPVRILEREQRVRVVVEPGEVEEVALGGAGRIERERVEEVVDLADPPAQI